MTEEQRLNKKLAQTRWWAANKHKHLEKNRVRGRLWRQKNGEAIAIKRRAHYERNKESVLKQSREYRLANPQIGKAYLERNKLRLREQKRLYMRRRLANPLHRLVCNMRKRVIDALDHLSKSARTIELLGCSGFELKAHLEKQFDSNMTWENYGSYWHVDHIIPCASFDLSIPEQQRKCFHHSNLQPLEARENIRKGKRLNPEAKALNQTQTV